MHSFSEGVLVTFAGIASSRTMAVAVGLLVLLLAVPAAYAANYIVGDASGWETGVDYTTWASGKTFLAGDTLCKYDEFI